MPKEIRETGIDIIGTAPWGTHFCQFYQTKQDLVDILVPYFKAGLTNNEFCMWVTAEPLDGHSTRKAMIEAMPDFNRYLSEGQIEIIPHTEWYLKKGVFNTRRVLNGWVDKLNQAIARGYDGLRLTGNTFWLERNGWKKFTEYEAEINNVIGKYRMLALCTYCLDKCNANEVIDVITNHEFALLKKEGKWELIENATYKKTKESLRELNKQLNSILESITDGFFTLEGDLVVTYCNRAAERFFGRRCEEILGRNFFEAFPEAKGSIFEENYRQVIKDRQPVTFETYFEPSGNWYDVRVYPYENGIAVYFRVTTERKRAEQALKESEHDLNRAQAVAHTGSWRLNVQRNELLWSDESHRIFGIPRGTPMTYETFLSAVHPEDRKDADRKWTAALRGEPYDIEHRILAGNDIKWIHEKAELEFDEHGVLLSGFGTCQDITERKRAEEAVRESQSRLQRLFDSEVIGIIVVTLEGQIIEANDAFLGMVGYSRDDLLAGRIDWRKMTPPEYTRLHDKATDELFTNGSCTPFEKECIRKDGKRIPAMVGATLWDNSTDNPSWVSFVLDISKLREAETMLHHSEATYRMLVESSPDGILSIDVRGHIIDCNQEICTLTGFDREELRSKEVSQFIANITPEKMEAYQVILRTTGQFEDEFRVISRDGQEFPLWAKAVAINDMKGDMERIIIYLRDMTERKKLDELKDEFIGLVSHELRTPLTVITGCVSTVLTEWDRLPRRETQQLLQDAMLESESLSHLVENLLELSRFQAQQLTLYVEPTNIQILITETISKIKRQAPSYQFLTDLPAELQPVNADPTRVKHILYNLLENAVKYSPPESPIKVSVRAEPERLVIGVSDQGKGLSRSEQAKLFTPFQRLEHIRTDVIKGIGLGLIVCRRLVEVHGGAIWVESKPGEGSTFFFSLPCKETTDARRD